jgi:phage terminase small subunit
MSKDEANLKQSKKDLEEYIYSIKPNYFTIDRQGDLFSGFSLEPICKINWDSSSQVVKLAKDLGFNTTVQDKKTGEDKDSVLEKTLKTQKAFWT